MIKWRYNTSEQKQKGLKSEDRIISLEHFHKIKSKTILSLVNSCLNVITPSFFFLCWCIYLAVKRSTVKPTDMLNNRNSPVYNANLSIVVVMVEIKIVVDVGLEWSVQLNGIHFHWAPLEPACTCPPPGSVPPRRSNWTLHGGLHLMRDE